MLFCFWKTQQVATARVILCVRFKFNIIALRCGFKLDITSVQKHISLIPVQRFAWQDKYFWFDDLCSCVFLFTLGRHFFFCCTCTFFISFPFVEVLIYGTISYAIFCCFSLVSSFLCLCLLLPVSIEMNFSLKKNSFCRYLLFQGRLHVFLLIHHFDDCCLLVESLSHC